MMTIYYITFQLNEQEFRVPHTNILNGFVKHNMTCAAEYLQNLNSFVLSS